MGKADATTEEVFDAAHMAGADEFTERLPCCFEHDSMLEENGLNPGPAAKSSVWPSRAP